MENSNCFIFYFLFHVFFLLIWNFFFFIKRNNVSFEIKPVLYALKFDDYFTTFKIVNQPGKKEIYTLLADVMATNFFIRYFFIHLSSVTLGEVPVYLFSFVVFFLAQFILREWIPAMESKILDQLCQVMAMQFWKKLYLERIESQKALLDFVKEFKVYPAIYV